jgi:hypothetical protein
MFTKIVRIAAGIALWGCVAVIALGLFAGYAAVPLFLPMAARTQGTKYLGHRVELRKAFLNPVTLRLRLNDFKILDDDGGELVGFREFWVDVDAAKLLRKQYRIESAGFDGLTINCVLLPGNKINLMALMPASAGAPRKNSAEQRSPSSASPEFAVDRFILRNGKMSFTDRSIGVGFVTRLSGIQLDLAGISSRPDCSVTVKFKANIDDKGTVSTDAQLKPFVKPMQMEAAFTLSDYAMRALTPYVGKYTGRAVKDGGRLDVQISYRIENNKLKAGHKVLVQNLDFGEKYDSRDALRLPFGLALALLKDTQGRIDVSLPVKGDLSDPKFEYFPLLGQVAVNFFMKLVTSPFKALALLAPDGSDMKEPGVLSFAPGVSELSEAGTRKIELLYAAMKARPGLSFRINGGYDPDADWNAIKTKVFEEDIAGRLKDQSATESSVYETLYSARFTPDEFQLLKGSFTKDAVTDEAAFTAEMKRRLIEKSEVDKTALEALARARADAVYAALVTAGMDSARVKQGSVRPAIAIMNKVPTEFVLTVLSDTKQEQVENAGKKQ